jgi:phage replication-related protein YjqB (UPF0714/DUF867 family)
VADLFKSFAELSAAYTEGTDFTVKYEKKGSNFAVIAIHGGGIEVGSSELMYAIQAARQSWSWYEFNARLSSGNSVLHLTSTNFDDPRAIDVVSNVDRVISVHGAAGTEPKTLIGGLDVLTKDLVRKELEAKGFIVEEATTESGIAGQEPLNIANRSRLGGVQLELTTKQRAMFFKNEDTSRTWRENPANWSQAMYDYRDAVLIATDKALRLKSLGRDRISIIDLNDVIGTTKPVNPNIGQIFIDETRTPAMMQKWTGSAWEDLGEVSPETSGDINDLDQKLKDMASDSLISYMDRQRVKDNLTSILGIIPDDASVSLPTAAQLDASFKGDFYTVRKSATNAGISTNNATYKAAETAYTNLKNYLETFLIKPWDTSFANQDANIAITPQTWRDKWLQYALGLQALQNLIAFNLKSEIDKIEVGGANLLNDTAFVVRPLAWNGATTEVVPSGLVGVPNSVKTMKDPANNSYGFTVYGKETLKAGQNYMLSFEMKLDSTVSSINYIYLRGDNITNTRLNDVTADVSKAGTFVRYTLLITPSTDVVNAGILIGLNTPNFVSFEARKVQLEKGTKASDWSLSNADVTNGINDVNGKIDGLKIGVRNLIRNSTFNISNSDGSLASWRFVHASYIVEPPADDKPDSNVMRVISTGQTANIYYSAYSNFFPAKTGDVFTVSMDIKVKDLAAYDVQTPFLFEYYDATDARIQYKIVNLSDLKATFVNDTWARVSLTYPATTAGIVKGSVRLIMYKNGDVSYREVQVEQGNIPTDYKAAPEDLINQYSFIEQRLSDAEQKIGDDSIVNTVINSTAYLQQINAKADASSLGNYATSDALNEAVAGVSGEIDKKIAGIDFSPYTKKSELTQTSDYLKAIFEKSGGINMLKNSVGFANGDFWTVTGWMETVRTDELSQLGYNSGFYCANGHSMTMIQEVYTTIGQVYSFSYYLKKTVDSGTNSYARVDILDATDVVIGTAGYPSNSGITNGFEKLTITFTAQTAVTKVKYTTGSGTDATATAFMLNIGEIPLEWSLAVGELYNTTVQMNQNGMRVADSDGQTESSSTVMTPQMFAGFYDVDGDGVLNETKGSADEVFRVDKDEFVQKKATVKEEITMGNLKVVKIQSTASTGWAWISNTDDN